MTVPSICEGMVEMTFTAECELLVCLYLGMHNYPPAQVPPLIILDYGKLLAAVITRSCLSLIAQLTVE